jgi:hypothetical protein
MTYPDLTWKVISADRAGQIARDDANYALEAIRLREHPRAIEKFIDVSIRIKAQEARRNPCTDQKTTSSPTPQYSPQTPKQTCVT